MTEMTPLQTQFRSVGVMLMIIFGIFTMGLLYMFLWEPYVVPILNAGIASGANPDLLIWIRDQWVYWWVFAAVAAMFAAGFLNSGGQAT